MAVSPIKYRFTTGEYHLMGKSGIFHEDDRVELIEGEIVTMAPIGNRHAGCVLYLTQFFTQKLGDRVFVNVQNPVHLDDLSEPQPDITLLQPSESFYRDRHPQPADIFLIVEVTASPSDYDRSIKVPLYAKHGIPEFWIVDIENNLVDIFREPENETYQFSQTFKPSDSISGLSFPEIHINVQDIIG